MTRLFKRLAGLLDDWHFDSTHRWLSPVVVAVELIAVALLTGCPPEPAPPIECSMVESPVAPPGVSLDRILVGQETATIVVNGLNGSTPPQTTVSIGDATATSDDNGAFSLSVANADATDAINEDGRLTLTVDDEAAGPFRLRDGAAARRCAISAAIFTGTAPNDLAIAKCDDVPVAIIPVTTDSALDAIALSTSAAQPPDVGFPFDDAGRGGGPWHVSVHENRQLAAVTLRDQNGVAVVDVCSGMIIASTRSDSGDLIDVDPPISLTTPFDVDGDGAPDALVEAMLLSGPQGVTFVGDSVFASFTNFLEPAIGDVDVQKMGPGVVVQYIFDAATSSLTEQRRIPLPFQNPQALTVAPNGQVWASATGPLALDDGRCCKSGGPAGLVSIDPTSGVVDNIIPMTPFVPATPAFVDDTIVVGSLVRAEVRIGPSTARDLDGFTSLLLGDADEVESIFEIIPSPSGLVFAAVYGADELWAIDVRSATIAPPPLDFPLVVGPGGGSFRGVIAGDFDDVGQGAVVLNLSSEVRPIDLRQVVGP